MTILTLEAFQKRSESLWLLNPFSGLKLKKLVVFDYNHVQKLSRKL